MKDESKTEKVPVVAYEQPEWVQLLLNLYNHDENVFSFKQVQNAK